MHFQIRSDQVPTLTFAEFLPKKPKNRTQNIFGEFLCRVLPQEKRANFSLGVRDFLIIVKIRAQLTLIIESFLIFGV